MNTVVIMGNLTRDVELSYLAPFQAVGKFDIAVNEKWTTKDGEKKEKVSFIPVTVFGKQAENCATYLKKGSPALVQGKIQQDSWTDKDSGKKRSRLFVIAQHVTFLGTKDGTKKETLPENEPPAQGDDGAEPNF